MFPELPRPPSLPDDPELTDAERAHLQHELARAGDLGMLAAWLGLCWAGMCLFFATLLSDKSPVLAVVAAAVGFGGLAFMIWPTRTSTEGWTATIVHGPVLMEKVGTGRQAMRRTHVGGLWVESAPHWRHELRHGNAPSLRVAVGPERRMGHVLAVAGGPSAEREAAAGLGPWPAMRMRVLVAGVIAFVGAAYGAVAYASLVEHGASLGDALALRGIVGSDEIGVVNNDELAVALEDEGAFRVDYAAHIDVANLVGAPPEFRAVLVTGDAQQRLAAEAQRVVAAGADPHVEARLLLRPGDAVAYVDDPSVAVGRGSSLHGVARSLDKPNLRFFVRSSGRAAADGVPVLVPQHYAESVAKAAIPAVLGVVSLPIGLMALIAVLTRFIAQRRFVARARSL